MSNARTDLDELLQEQIGFLERSCSSFDEGFVDEAKRIAVVVRVLLHDTNSSHSLFQQLSYKEYKLINTCPNVDSSMPGRIFQAGLAVPSLKGYIPRFHLPPRTEHPVWCKFDSWWNSPVIKTKERVYSRRELVLLLANKEGGAHVNPSLTAHYEKLKKEGSGFTYFKEGGDPEPMTQEEHACLRQIAYEILESITIIKSGDAPIDDHDDRPTAFKFPVYMFIKAEDSTPIHEIKVATIESLNNLLPVFDNKTDAEKAETMLRGDYGIKEFDKNGFVSFLKKVILPNNIEHLTFNPDVAGEGHKSIDFVEVTHVISSLDTDYSDDEIIQKLSDGIAKRA